MIKRLIFIALVVSGTCQADDSTKPSYEKMERATAKISRCGAKHPCNIEITENEKGFSVRVTKAAEITEDGVLKYLPSATYYQINNKGEMVNSTPTP